MPYKRSRYYDPATGQFTQEDPIGLAGGMNLYGFADGDPVNFSDPFGLDPCRQDDALCLLGRAGWETLGGIIGGGVGGVGGFLSGAACGPLSEVCAPAFAVAGFTAGVTAGKMTGSQLFDLAYNTVQMARAGKGRGGNQQPNADVNRIVNEYDLNRQGRRALHDEITGQNHTLDEIREIAEELAKQNKYRNNPPPSK